MNIGECRPIRFLKEELIAINLNSMIFMRPKANRRTVAKLSYLHCFVPQSETSHRSKRFSIHSRLLSGSDLIVFNIFDAVNFLMSRTKSDNSPSLEAAIKWIWFDWAAFRMIT